MYKADAKSSLDLIRSYLILGGNLNPVVKKIS